jgi:hypothetical protein
MPTIILAALCGILLNILYKMDDYKKQLERANEKFVPKKFFERDWITILKSILGICIFLVCLDEIIHYSPKVGGFVKSLFSFIGFCGNEILMRLYSRTQKFINRIIDIKTNIADEKETG